VGGNPAQEIGNVDDLAEKLRKANRPITCRHCGGEMKIIAAIMKTAVVEKILKHVGLPHKPPDIAPARYAVQQPLFDT
jgi:hypothetical protein